MTIFTFADRIGRELVIRRYPQQNNRFICSFEHTETKRDKDDVFLNVVTHGNGHSLQTAIKDYVRQIRGKLLVLNTMSAEGQQQIVVPNNLSVPKFR